ncbi:MAG: polyprenyl synthetase family protein [bacterium]|nr:polyprenyl synthetase family protein [bacterium]
MEEQFLKTLSSYQKKIEKEIRRFFDRKIKKTKQPLLRSYFKLLKEFSLRPAKRIRPILINQGYLLAGGKNKGEILRTSIFIELIHNYLLIHDDIIDRDKIRRGGPTVHHYYRGGHYGESMAVVIGDLASSLGYEILTSSRFPANYRIRAAEKLNQVLSFTCYGQLLELSLLKKKKKTKKDVIEIYRNKTANYTFVGPLQIGAILAGANERFLKKIEKFSLPLGIAFQIKDDILDAEPGIDKQPQKLAEKLIKQSKKVLENERNFPRKEKQFLSALAEYIINRNV